jgi:hypothetical protein
VGAQLGKRGLIHCAGILRERQTDRYFAGALVLDDTASAGVDDSAVVQISQSETGTRPMSTANTHVAEIRQMPAINKSSITCKFDKLNEDRAFFVGLCCMGGMPKSCIKDREAKQDAQPGRISRQVYKYWIKKRMWQIVTGIFATYLPIHVWRRVFTVYFHHST